MATTAEEYDSVSADAEFPNHLDHGELEQETNSDFPVPDDFPSTTNVKNEKPEAEREEKKDWMENFKSTLLVSGVVIAVIGAIFAVAKKVKEA